MIEDAAVPETVILLTRDGTKSIGPRTKEVPIEVEILATVGLG
jgi:hypothetical protein